MSKKEKAAEKEKKMPQSLEAFRQQHPGDVTRGNAIRIDPLLLEVEEGFNIRASDSPELEEHIENLANAYFNDEYVPPILVVMKDGKPFIRDGHCRYAGLTRAINRGKEISHIPVQEYKGDDLGQQLLLITTNSGKRLSPTEEAVLYHRLHNVSGYKISEIAERVNKTPAHVSQRIELYSMPVKLKSYIDRGNIAASYASRLFSDHGTTAVDIIEEALRNQGAEDEIIGRAQSGNAEAAIAATEGEQADAQDATAQDGQEPAEATEEAASEEAKPKKPTRLTEGKVARQKRMSSVDLNFVRRELGRLASDLVKDDSRVRHVKARNQIDVSFSPEDFLLFLDVMERMDRYSEESVFTQPEGDESAGFPGVIREVESDEVTSENEESQSA